MCDFYNLCLSNSSNTGQLKNDGPRIDRTKISWTNNLKLLFSKKTPLSQDDYSFVVCQYRPFTKSILCYSRKLNERVYQQPKIYPNDKTDNIGFSVSGVGARSGFSILASNNITDLQFIDNGQFFPLKYFNEEKIVDSLFSGLIVETCG